MHRAGIPIGMQNLLRSSTGGVAFAQPPASSLNPYRIKTDEVGEAYIISSALSDKSILGVGNGIRSQMISST